MAAAGVRKVIRHKQNYTSQHQWGQLDHPRSFTISGGNWTTHVRSPSVGATGPPTFVHQDVCKCVQTLSMHVETLREERTKNIDMYHQFHVQSENSSPTPV